MANMNWPLNTVPISQATDLVVPGANKEVSIIGYTVCNRETTNTANVTITLTDSDNNTLATIRELVLTPKETVDVDTKICIMGKALPDKIRVLSDRANVSFLFSGDQDDV